MLKSVSNARDMPISFINRVEIGGLSWLLPIIIELFPQAMGNRRFELVATDYFTKWVEAEALTNVRDMDVKKFVWKNIVTRLGVPQVLILDNGQQFDSKAFWEYCSNLGIIKRYSSPAFH